MDAAAARSHARSLEQDVDHDLGAGGRRDRTAGQKEGRYRCIVAVEPHDTLNNSSRAVERQYFEDLYIHCGGDFERMAARLLEGNPSANARKVQLRFNNLGLSVRALRDRFSTD